MRNFHPIPYLPLITMFAASLLIAAENDSQVRNHPDIASVGATAPPRIVTIGTITLELIRVPAGKYTVGSPKTEHERYSDEPTPTVVTMTRDYWLGKTDVTQGQYQALMGNNPSLFTMAGIDAPVEQVSWDDAMAYCQKLTDHERSAGRLPDGYIYTLPTETQWECACRAGTTTPYAGNLDDMGWYAGNAGITTHPVAQKKPNSWGFYDMHGNVFQWTSSRYGNSMLGRSGGKDPAGPTVGKVRVLRGGSFEMPAVPARSSYRFHLPPETKSGSIGFRVALTVPPIPEVPQPGGRRGGGGQGRLAAQTQPAATQQLDPQQQVNDQNVVPPDAVPIDPNQNLQDQTTPAPLPATQPNLNNPG